MTRLSRYVCGLGNITIGLLTLTYQESFSEILEVIGDTRKSAVTFNDLTFNIDVRLEYLHHFSTLLKCRAANNGHPGAGLPVG